MAPQPTNTLRFDTDDADMNPDSFEIRGDTPDKKTEGGKPAVNAGRIGLAFFPLTPVPYKGEGSVWAYARIALYATAGYLAWSRARKLSMVMLGAAAVSATTSATATAWNGDSR